jgi:hypothetical protein
MGVQSEQSGGLSHQEFVSPLHNSISDRFERVGRRVYAMALDRILRTRHRG